MKLMPINNVNFTGREVPYASKLGESGLKSMQGFYKDSSVETTLGAYHSQPKNKAYFADPMEYVPNDIKERVDFVVYDNEPGYPKTEDIKKNYLEHNRTNYREQFENIREYYYRREMGRYANVNEAKYQQWQAAQCTALYDKAGHLRYQKESAEDEIEKLVSEKNYIKQGIENTKQELKLQESLNKNLEKHVANLKDAQKAYQVLDAVVEKGLKNEQQIYEKAAKRLKEAQQQENYLKELENTNYYNDGREAYISDGLKYGKFENTTQTYKSVNSVRSSSFRFGSNNAHALKQNDLIESSIRSFEQIIKEGKQTIKDMKSYIAELNEKTKLIDENINSKSTFIEECKTKLKPLFEELEGFYKKQGIKIIKK